MSKYLLTNGNRELAKDGIFTWSIPALNARLSDGSNFVTCPNAGICANLCYARSGTYRFSNVLKAHTDKLEMVLGDLESWKIQLIEELKAKRYQNEKSVRIHDAGDFFSMDYLIAWLDIARATPDVFFYAYTKEVAMVKAVTLPENFVIIFLMGGKQDHLVNKELDRHADVFPTMEALVNAGYADQGDNDLLAATLPTPKIGIVSNNIKHFQKRQGDGTFASLQQQRNDRIGQLGE